MITDIPFSSDRSFNGTDKSLTFGHEKFVLSYANPTPENDSGGILYSTDAEDWTNALVDDINGFQDCAFGLDRFLCLRGDTLSWSLDGIEWHHGETQHDFELLDIMFSKDRFVALWEEMDDAWCLGMVSLGI